MYIRRVVNASAHVVREMGKFHSLTGWLEGSASRPCSMSGGNHDGLVVIDTAGNG